MKNKVVFKVREVDSTTSRKTDTVLTRKLLYLFAGLLAGMIPALGQTVDCGNLGFEEGTTRGWVLTNGVVSDVGTQAVFGSENAGTFENGHRLMQPGEGNDPKITAEAIPVVPPGSNYAIRIGNVTRGTRYDRIRTSMLITPDNTLLQYKFAVILQNPNHEPYQQPGFSLRITDKSGSTIACSFYNVTASGSIDGFRNQGDLRYRNWTTGAVDLRDFIGQTITIEATAHGCTERGHFGYAYFDAQCLKAEITQGLFCPAYDQTVTLKAPDGFASYQWSNGATTATIQVPPSQGARYWVKVKPYSSLNASCEFQFDHVVSVPPAEAPTPHAAAICEGDAFRLGDSTYTRAGTYLTRVRRGAGRCDSLVRLTLSVRPLGRFSEKITICEGQSYRIGSAEYRSSGTYTTRFARTGKCDSLVTTELTVRPLNLAVSRDTLIRPGTRTLLQAGGPSGGPYRYTWSPESGLSCPTCPVTWAAPDSTTRYTVTVEDTELGCVRTASVVLTVGHCVFFAPDAFTPNGDGTNDQFFIQGTACVRQIRELIIYDRWGEVIYHRKNLPPSQPDSGWNGLYKEALAEAGVYAYRVAVEFVNGQVVQQRGTVTLLR